MLIGIDLDNTIVCYDHVVHRAAVEQGLIPTELPASKGAIRDFLRQCGKEEAWVRLQGYLYGPGMRDAKPFPGAPEFFATCVRRDVPTCIISHRTRYPFRGPRHDLHQAAHDWLARHGFYNGAIALAPQHVHLELSKQTKLERVVRRGCDYFIDDLPEFLEEPGFPAGVERILFDPNKAYARCRCLRATSWDEIARLVLT
jgi:hypothetical protein